MFCCYHGCVLSACTVVLFFCSAVAPHGRRPLKSSKHLVLVLALLSWRCGVTGQHNGRNIYIYIYIYISDIWQQRPGCARRAITTTTSCLTPLVVVSDEPACRLDRYLGLLGSDAIHPT